MGYNIGMKNFDLVILGAGPAGLTAGIYAARGGLKCAVIEQNTVGGQASAAAAIENFPGVDVTDGFALCYNMQQQCKALGVEFIFDSVSSLDISSPQKTFVLGDGGEATSRAVIIATGAAHRKLGLEDEDRLCGRGVSYCATCDGALYRGKTVAVVGGGNTAAEEALYLSNLAAKTYLIHRRDALRADDILARRVLSSNVEVVWDSVVAELHGQQNLTQITLKNVKTDVLTSVLVDCVFVAIGQVPNSQLFDVAKDEAGYILTDEQMQTSIDGVYAAGDVRKKSLRQVVTACADGAIAADSAIKALMTKA